MDESGGVVQVEGTRSGHALGAENGHGELLAKSTIRTGCEKVWSLSGDTHPRKYDSSKVESLSTAARRCAKEDLGVVIKNWRKKLTVSYSARDPRDPRYCENELLYVLAAKHHGPVNMNRNSPYELRWAKFAEISRDSQTDSKKEPIDRKYAPWVHSMFSLPHERVEETFLVN